MLKAEKSLRKHHKKGSIKWKLIAIVLFCWVLPLSLISGITIYFMTDQLNNQVVKTMTDSTGNSIILTMSNINSLVNSSHMATYDSTIKDAYRNYCSTGIEVNLYSETRSFMKRQYENDDRLLSTIICFNGLDNLYYVNNVSRSYRDMAIYKEDIHPLIKEYASSLGRDIGFFNYNDRVFMVRNICDSYYRPYAAIIMELNRNVVFQSFRNVAWHTDCTLWLNDTPVNIKGNVIDIQNSEIDFGPEKNSNIYNKEKTMLYGKRTADYYTIEYAVNINSSRLTAQIIGFKNILIGVGILMIPLMIFVIRFFYKNITNPISKIINALIGLEEGELGIQLNESFPNREFQYFSNAFNKMSERLKYQFDRLYMEELALRDAKIMALQSQINPHFLNNTLEIINWEARMSGDTKVSRMIEALSQMLDAAMDRKGKPLIRLSDEMLYVDAYFYIIGERFGKRLTVKREIDESLLNYYVPRLIMQPIVENAVEHGVEPKQKGTIIIRVYKDDKNIILEVENDGIMTKEDEERIILLLSEKYDVSRESSSNLGIRNVYQRLKFIFGSNANLSIKINSFGHSVAKIIIPIDQSKQ